MGNLAYDLERQGKHQEAEDLLRQTLAARQRVLGNGHPDTLKAMDGLAAFL